MTKLMVMTKLMSLKEFVEFCKLQRLLVKAEINTDSYEPGIVSSYCESEESDDIPRYVGFPENREDPTGPDKMYVIEKTNAVSPTWAATVEDLLKLVSKGNWKVTMEKHSEALLQVNVTDDEGFGDGVFVDITTGKIKTNFDLGDK